jgi:hypothetical protein
MWQDRPDPSSPRERGTPKPPTVERLRYQAVHKNGRKVSVRISRSSWLLSLALLTGLGPVPTHAGWVQACRDIFARSYTALDAAAQAQLELQNEIAALKQEMPEITQMYSEADLSKAVGWSLRGRAQGHIPIDATQGALKRNQDFLDLVSLANEVRSSPSSARVAKLSKWVDDSHKGMFLYANLNELSKSLGLSADDIFESILASPTHEFRRSPYGLRQLLTVSFEKESYSPGVTEYYKLPRYSDDQWFAMPAEKRYEILSEALKKRRHGLLGALLGISDRSPAVKTARAPKDLGSITAELAMDSTLTSHVFAKKYPLEFKSAKYHISPKQILNRSAEAEKILGESDAFHYHLVVELPRNYADFGRFKRWWKWRNDQAYFQGLEGGLHADTRTGILLPSRLDKLSKFPEQNSWDDKFYGVGLRAGIYGEASQPRLVRVGLELRDVTRDRTRLARFMNSVADDLSTEAWKGMSDDSFAPMLDPLRLYINAIPLLRREGLKDEFLRDAFGVEPNFAVALADWTHVSLTTKKGNATDITKAHDQYIASLKSLQSEIADMKARGLKVEKADFQMALRWNLTDWAKQAKISELYAK